MTTRIISNGSKWAGEKPDSVAKLLRVLASEPLDRCHEGDFITAIGRGGRMFFGNFFRVSHVFQIETTDAAVINKLTAAISENQRRPDYLSQPDARKRAKLEAKENKKREAALQKARRNQLRAELRGLS